MFGFGRCAVIVADHEECTGPIAADDPAAFDPCQVVVDCAFVADRVARFFEDAVYMAAKVRPEQTKKPLPKAKAQVWR